ncbi:MAG: YfhO family protein, partial [Stellaceae bacterium]
MAGAIIAAYAAVFHAPSFDSGLYGDYLRAHLAGRFQLWAVLAFDVGALFALATAWRLRGWFIVGPLICVTALDLGYFNVANFRLEQRDSSGAATLPPDDRMARSIEAPDFPRIIYDGLRYCRWIRATVPARRLSVGTNDGGVLPAATARLYKSIAADSPPGLALAACAFVCAADDGSIKKVPDALPRVRFVPERKASLVAVAIEEVDRGEIRSMRASSAATVRLTEDLPTRVSVEIDSPVAGRLVLADIWYPGWIATVDGNPTTIECAHGVFRCVRVPSGDHRVVFEYAPTSLRLGLALSVVGAVCWCGLLGCG